MLYEHEVAVVTHLGLQAVEDAKSHAMACFPEESCGFIIPSLYGAPTMYVPCVNKHEKPLEFFRIEDPRFDAAVQAGEVLAVVHSHPYGPMFPSMADMEGQIATDAPYLIITLNEEGVSNVVAWGDQLPTAPLIGRPFLHGVFDCFSLIRDVCRLGREELLKQGIHWPHEPMNFPDCPRADAWWQDGDDLYEKNLAPWGWQKIAREEATAGDVFLVAFGDASKNPKKQLNHGGLLLEHGQVLHHLPTRLSCREPGSIWARAADCWVRKC